MKFDQLRRYSMRKTFFWKDHSKSMVKNLVPDKCWTYLWISCLKFYSLFLFLIQLGYYQHILKLRCFCLMNNFFFFLKKKEETRDLELNSCSEVRRSLDSLIKILRHLENMINLSYGQHTIKIVLTLICVLLYNITLATAIENGAVFIFTSRCCKLDKIKRKRFKTTHTLLMWRRQYLQHKYGYS